MFGRKKGKCVVPKTRWIITRMKRDVGTAYYLFNDRKIDVTKLEKSFFNRLPPDFTFTAT